MPANCAAVIASELLCAPESSEAISSLAGASATRGLDSTELKAGEFVECEPPSEHAVMVNAHPAMMTPKTVVGAIERVIFSLQL